VFIEEKFMSSLSPLDSRSLPTSKKLPELTRAPGVLDLVKQSLRGDADYDYTQGSISRASILLAIPMILELALESVFAVVDIFFVAQLGTAAVATVGLTESMMSILYALAIGIGMGTTALVARRVGEGDKPAAALAAGQALWIGLAISAGVALVGVTFTEELLSFMGAENAVIAEGANYTRIMFAGNFTIVFLFLINAIFRGAGDAMLALKSLWLANAINIVLDPLLIFGIGPFPELGVEGAAVATNIGRAVGVAYAISFLIGRSGRLRVGAAQLRMQLAIIVSLLRISAGGVAQYLIATMSWVLLMQIVAGFGSAVIAGYVIAIRVLMFAILPAWGLSNAAATLAGQNLGAGKPDRAQKAVWAIAWYCTLYMGVAGVLCWVFAPAIIGFFSPEAAAVENGALALRIVSYGFVPAGFGMALTQAFNGAGDTLTPTLINFFAFWLAQVPLAYVLAVVSGFGAQGVYWAIFVSDLIIGVVACVAFARGRWKLREV
jgi:putative MATE family efflux protein